MSRPFIITGVGRSGSMWAAETLQACHINCGHQAIFRHEHTLGKRLHWGRYHGDSSFEAVPMLKDRPPRELIVTITREPLAVLRSWRKRGLFTDRIRTWEQWALFSRVLDRHFPEVLEHANPLAAAAQYYVSWLKEAIEHSAVVLKLEGLTAKGLCAAVDRPLMYCEQADAVPTNTNTNLTGADRGPNSYEDIPASVRDMLREYSAELGYE